jgi:two-component system chemotaxis sensor kinase CheA
MADQQIVELIERLSEELVLLDLGDLPALAQLHTDFETLAAWAKSSSSPALQQVCDGSANTVSAIILEEGDAQQLLGILTAALSYLQAVVRDDRKDCAPPAFLSDASPDTVQDQPADGIDPLENADLSLLQDFVQEANEHLDAADVHLLTLEGNPGDKDAIDAVFRAFHTIKGAAGFLQLADLQGLSHEAETLLDEARKGKLRLVDSVIDNVFEAVDGLKRLVELLDKAMSRHTPLARPEFVQPLIARIREAAAEHDSEPLGEMLVKAGLATTQQVNAALEQQKTNPNPLGVLLAQSGDVPARETVEMVRRQREQRYPSHSREAIKVDADRLDRLVDLIGELVIAEAMVLQCEEVDSQSFSPLGRRLAQMDKITRELQEISMSLRMVALRSAFQKMARLTRDLAKKGRKQVDFQTSGEDTELDKNVVDQVSDPLMHMIRNAIDHGLEPPEERLAAGKPEVGRVELRAFHKGGNVYIEIEDDGRGLDREAILAKARERGLVGDGELLSDRDVFDLIFHAGFSTAKQITDVSGRGVGMDVVKRNITALRGQVDIRSVPGKGSVFSIRLPLTLAIIDGMVVQAGAERYILPIANVVRSVRPAEQDVQTVAQRGEMLLLQGRLIPLFRLAQILGIDDAKSNPCEAIVLIVEEGGQQVGLMADELLGQQQTVIKSLGDTMQGQGGISGAAIMPDGQVGLILDIAGLVRIVEGNSNDSAGNENSNGRSLTHAIQGE